MSMMEEYGCSREKFHKMYEQYDGFNGIYNKNSPSYSSEDDFFSFVKKGAENLATDNPDLVEYVKEGMRM